MQIAPALRTCHRRLRHWVAHTRTVVEGTTPSDVINSDVRGVGFRQERVDLDDEVVAEGDEADDGEEVDEDDGEKGGEEDAPTVLRHRPNDVEQRLLAIHHIQQLKYTHATTPTERQEEKQEKW